MLAPMILDLLAVSVLILLAAWVVESVRPAAPGRGLTPAPRRRPVPREGSFVRAGGRPGRGAYRNDTPELGRFYC